MALERLRIVRVLPALVTLLALATLATVGCSSAAVRASRSQTVTNEYRGWTVRITPALDAQTDSWRATVRVWPPDRRPETLPGIDVYYPASAHDERSVVAGGMDAARRYIDASQSQHQE